MQLKYIYVDGKRQARPLAERFWEKVEKTYSCWLWTAGLDKDGYGVIQLNDPRRPQQAHRVAWFLTYGYWPTPNALHKCDVRRCVRPKHLYEGTKADNTRDMMKRGRHAHVAPRGSANGLAKLTEKKVLVIRRRYASERISQKELAAKYKVDASEISRLVRREIWKHI